MSFFVLRQDVDVHESFLPEDLDRLSKRSGGDEKGSSPLATKK